ncbi:MAG: hypothetical protein FJ387_07615 [Verrucomicrobia bacterium]|nr:hypothetical protein [Verrucomicrobiota bacterium]
MIQLHSDYLVFETPAGGIPCAIDRVVVELAMDSVEGVDPELVKNAAAGVLHFFKTELGRDYVTVGEFSAALSSVLRGFGLEVTAAAPAASDPTISEADLRQIAVECGQGFELAFFSRLRAVVRARLEVTPKILRFSGLRSCVKQLAGASRWTAACQQLNDQIVEYLRGCLHEHGAAAECALVIR